MLSRTPNVNALFLAPGGRLAVVIVAPNPNAPDADDGVAFTDDSRDALSWGADNTARLWDACTDCESPSALLALAHSRVTRALTQQERGEFGVS